MCSKERQAKSVVKSGTGQSSCDCYQLLETTLRRCSDSVVRTASALLVASSQCCHDMTKFCHNSCSHMSQYVNMSWHEGYVYSAQF